MNLDQISRILKTLAPEITGYKLILSGKESKKVDGLYKPDTAEIILHNKNFKNDHQCIYTAIHELAHHVHFTSPNPPNSTRAHTTEYWSIFHGLLKRAESLDLLQKVTQIHPQLAKIGEKIKTQCLEVGGEVFRKMGALLSEAHSICHEEGLAFEDFLDRFLLLPKNSAKLAMKAHSQKLPVNYGIDALKVISRARGADSHEEIMEKLKTGSSLEMIKSELKLPETEPKNPRELLERQKERLIKELQRIQNRIESIEKELERENEHTQSSGL